MKHIKLFCVASVLLPLLLNAQLQTDSSSIYEQRIKNQYKNALDAVEKSAEYQENEAKLVAYNKSKNNYNGFGFNLNYSSVSASNLNNSLKASGFNSFNNYAIGGGLSSHYKRGAFIGDANLLNFSFANTVKNASTNQEISLMSFDFFQTQIGYAIVNKRNFTIYPYLGIGFRVSNMTLKNVQIINPAGTNISNFINTPQYVRANSLKITYQAGIAMDVKISNNTSKNGAAFLSFKTGLNNTFGDENFRIDNAYKFNPDVNIGGLQFQLGIKFVKYKTSVRPQLEE